MMGERREIRPATQVVEPQRAGVAQPLPEPRVIHCAVSPGLGNVVREIADERLERGRRRGREPCPACDVVLVDVGDHVGVDGVLQLLHPLGRPHQAPFLGVPRDEDNRPRRPQRRSRQRREGPGRLQHGDGSAHVVAGAWGPSVAMCPHDDPFVRVGGPPDDAERIPDGMQRPRTPLAPHLQPQPRGARTDSVLKRQPSLPPLGSRRTSQLGKEAARVAVSHRDYRDARHGEGILGQADGARGGRGAGRGRITARVHHGPTLDATRRPHRSAGVNLPAHVAVVQRVRVQDQPHGAVILRLPRLDPPEGSAVARHDNAAAHADAQGVEGPVVRAEPCIDVHDGRRHVAVVAVRIEGRHLRPGAGAIAPHRRLVEVQPHRGRPQAGGEPSAHDLRLWQVDQVLLGPRLETPRSQLRDHVIPRRGLGRGTGHVGTGAQSAGHQPGTRRVRDSEETRFEACLGGAHGWGDARLGG